MLAFVRGEPSHEDGGFACKGGEPPSDGIGLAAVFKQTGERRQLRTSRRYDRVRGHSLVQLLEADGDDLQVIDGAVVGAAWLALPGPLLDMLRAHMAPANLSADDRDALLFTAPSGGPLRYTNWPRRSWYPATIAAGLGQMVEDAATGRRRYDGLGFHDLRRASATGLVAAGVDVNMAQSVLGHTDTRVTLDLYAQVVTEQQQAAADAMATRFLDPNPRDKRGMEAGSEGTHVWGMPLAAPATRCWGNGGGGRRASVEPCR
jgi:Phage integrase family